MQALPFHVTSEALNYIRNCSRPRPGMQASICFAYDAEEYDEAGHLTAKFAGEFLSIGYHYKSTVRQWPRLVFGGRRVAIHPRHLDRLRRKMLTLRKLDLDPDSVPHVFPEILVTA
jgi:hypothetical protein